MKYYVIDGCNESFRTLSDAKYYISFAYTSNERIKYFGKDTCYILGIDSRDEVRTITEIKIDDNGRESFGKTKRY